MKVLSQLLGRYSSHKKPLILFRLPDTDVLLYRLSDIEPLFSISSPSFKNGNYKNCYKDHEDTYLDTKVLGDLALKHKSQSLEEISKLKPNDYSLGLADAILRYFPQFVRAPKEEHIWESVHLPLENLEDVIDRDEEKAVKEEPASPPSINQIMPETRNAMALDKVLLSSNELRRQSIMDLGRPTIKRQKIGTTAWSPPQQTDNVSAADHDKRLHSSSAVNNNDATSLQGAHKTNSYSIAKGVNYSPPQQHNSARRLSAKHKNSLNLTIFAPSYHEQLGGVRSAPINSNFHKPIPKQAIQPQRSSYGKQFSTSHTIAPASATVARPPFTHQSSPRRHEFAIPPIVPSQQQPPHTAHPSSRDTAAYQQYVATPHYGAQHHKAHPPPPPSATTATYRNHDSHPLAVTAASIPLPPKTPTTNSFAALQRQQYLQPFEHLFDTIETTRTLKSTLDDQIRRSSTLIQTLQASATTIEGLVRNQVKEAQSELMGQMEKTLDVLLSRIEAIETRLDNRQTINYNSNATTTHGVGGSSNSHKKQQQQQQLHRRATAEHQQCLPSPLPSSTREEGMSVDNLTAFSEKKRAGSHEEGATTAEELQMPPTIVRSQNDIGPQEYHTMLNTLRDRLDRLERQIET